MPAVQLKVPETPLSHPPLTEEYWPLAVLMYPAADRGVKALAVLLFPPLTEE